MLGLVPKTRSDAVYAAGPHRDDLQIMMNDRLELGLWFTRPTTNGRLGPEIGDGGFDQWGNAPFYCWMMSSEFDNERKRSC